MSQKYNKGTDFCEQFKSALKIKLKKIKLFDFSSYINCCQTLQEENVSLLMRGIIGELKCTFI